MLQSIKGFYYFLLERKKKKYLATLVRNGLSLGKDTTIMEGFFLDPTHCFLISIGDHCVLAPHVRLIAHDASTKKDLGYTRVGKVTIESDCFIGDSVVVLPGVTIGRGSVVGAGSVVTADIPPGTVAAGNPCRPMGSREDYIKKQQSLLFVDNTPFAEMDQQGLTRRQKQKMLQYLDSNQGRGYVR